MKGRIYEILLLRKFPSGMLVSYVQIARLIAGENARLVGRVLKYSDRFMNIPAYRKPLTASAGLPPDF